MKNVYKIAVYESERGWGSKIDDYMICLTYEDSIKFIEDFNSKNNLDTVPDWYMFAGHPEHYEINDEQYNILSSHNNKTDTPRCGVWLSQIK